MTPTKMGVAAVAAALVPFLPSLSSAAVGAAAADSHRASTVGITFTVNLERRTAASRQCSLEVARGSDGIDVLQAAVDQGCINGYQISASRYPPPGPWPVGGWPPSPKGHHWLRCIDAICDVHAAPGTGAPGTGWRVDWNGDDSRHAYWRWGLEGYAASPEDTVTCTLGAYS